MIAAAVLSTFSLLAKRVYELQGRPRAIPTTVTRAGLVEAREALEAHKQFTAAVEARDVLQREVRTKFDRSLIQDRTLVGVAPLISHGDAAADALDAASQGTRLVVETGFAAARCYGRFNKEFADEIAEAAQSYVWQIEEYTAIARSVRASVSEGRSLRLGITDRYLTSTSQAHYDALAKT